MTKLAPGWKSISEFVLLSPEGKRVSYGAYRDITGLCETCGEAIASHPKCEACGTFCGLGHFEDLSNYREHVLCGHCISRWQRADENYGRQTTWKEFLAPKLGNLRL